MEVRTVYKLKCDACGKEHELRSYPEVNMYIKTPFAGTSSWFCEDCVNKAWKFINNMMKEDKNEVS